VKQRLPGGPVPYLAGRSVVRTLRQPAYVLPPILFPLALLAFNSAGLASATRLPGFPSHSFLPFILAVPFIQGALFATMNAGTDLARDIQSGFLNRLALTPVRAPALIAGHLAGVAVLGFLQACVYLAVGLAVGSPLRSGPAGAVVLLALATLIAIGFGALGAFMALRTGSAESIQGLFPLLFVGLFISSMNAPRNLIAVTWFRDAATGNPVSYLIEGVRSLIIEGWNAQALTYAFTAAIVMTVLSLGLAGTALRMRLTRT
jgi:ABC-2 type transport system permease protein